MVDGIGGQRTDDADVIDDGADMGKEFADFGTGLTERFETKLGGFADEFRALKLGQLLTLGEASGHGLAIHLAKFRFRIEGFELGGPSGHAKPDDAFDFWMEAWGGE